MIFDGKKEPGGRTGKIKSGFRVKDRLWQENAELIRKKINIFKKGRKRIKNRKMVER